MAEFLLVTTLLEEHAFAHIQCRKMRFAGIINHIFAAQQVLRELEIGKLHTQGLKQIVCKGTGEGTVARTGHRQQAVVGLCS